MWYLSPFFFFFFFNDTATTEIYTLSLHDALPIYHLALALVVVAVERHARLVVAGVERARLLDVLPIGESLAPRSEEHTSELQSQSNLVCRLLLEKKKNNIRTVHHMLDLPTVAASQ